MVVGDGDESSRRYGSSAAGSSGQAGEATKNAVEGGTSAVVKVTPPTIRGECGGEESVKLLLGATSSPSPLPSSSSSSSSSSSFARRGALLSFAVAVALVLVLMIASSSPLLRDVSNAGGAGGTGGGGDAHTPPYTLVAACKLTRQRTPMFRNALASWLTLPSSLVNRFVIVDWNSEVDVRGLTRDVMLRHGEDENSTNVRFPRRVDVVHVVPNAGSTLDWKLSAANNLAIFGHWDGNVDGDGDVGGGGGGGGAGVGAVQTEYVLKVDCDTHLHPQFLHVNDLRRRRDAGPTFLTPSYRYSRDLNDDHLNGVFMAKTERVKDINGYDERLETYGFDDEDLYVRLVRSGEVHGNVTRVEHFSRQSLIDHVIHPPGAPASVTDKSNCLNQRAIIIARRMAKWNTQRRTGFAPTKAAAAAVETVKEGMRLSSTEVTVTAPVTGLQEYIGPVRWRMVLRACQAAAFQAWDAPETEASTGAGLE